MVEAFGSLGVVAGLSQAVYLAAAFALGTRLLARARRCRDLAAALLGVQLLFAMGFGYLLCGTGTALAMLAADPSPRLVEALLGAGNASTIVGLAAAAAFNARVFSPGERGPRVLAAGFVALQVVAWAGALATGAFETGRYESGWVRSLNGAMLAVNLWVAIEPLRYHRKLARRVPLGLAEPAVADRFLLWGLGSLARAALILMGPLAEWALAGLGEGERAGFSAATLALASALGLLTSLAYWLTFEPTPAYLRWVERRYRRAAA